MSLFDELELPYAAIKLNEVFFTDDGELYTMTRRGAKSCDGYGDIVRLDPKETVRLSYADTLTRRRITLTVDMVERLTGQGLIFFSSVLTAVDPYKNISYMVDALNAWQDDMFFHVPGHALIVVVSLCYHNISIGERMYWQIRFIAKGSPPDAQIDMARRLGMPVKRLPANAHGMAALIAAIPFYDSIGQVDDFDDVGYHFWFEGKTRCFDVVYEQYDDIRPMSSPAVAAIVGASCCPRILPFTTAGPFAEMQVARLAPIGKFPNCAHEFWNKFGTTYLRKLIRRPIGIPTTLTV